MSPPTLPRLLEPLFTTERMREIFADRGRLQAMLDFEAALARAEARAGIVPAEAAIAIQTRCRAEYFDMATLAKDAAVAGNLAIPMVKVLTALVVENGWEAAHR